MSLIAHYPLNGDATDYFGNDGTPTNVSWVDGKIGQAAQMNSGTISPLTKVNKTYSIAFWIKLKSSFTGSFRKFLTQSANRSPGFWFFPNDNRVHLQQSASSGNAGVNTITGLVVGEWTHIVFSCEQLQSGIQFSSYVNGVVDSLDFASGQTVVSTGDKIELLSNDHDIDDVRIYDHALSEKEVQETYKALVLSKFPEVNDNTVNSGNFITVPDSPTILGSTSIEMWLYPTSTARQTIWNNGYGGEGTINFERSSRELRFYSGYGGGNGGGYESLDSSAIPLNVWTHVVVTRAMPSGDVKWYINGQLDNTGNFSFSTIGETTFDLTIGTGYTNDFVGKLQGVRQYATVLSATDVESRYKTGLAIDNIGNMHSKYLVESGIINPNILDYTTWTLGTGGASGFSANGSTNENHRIIDSDPHGRDTVVWEARPEASSGADGGWNGTYYPIDNTKFYRFSVWIRRTVSGNGSMYFGLHGGNDAVQNRSNNTSNTNPYFTSGGQGSEWTLYVGHVWPAGSGSGGIHPETGRYTVSDGKTGSINDFVWGVGTTSTHHRSYLYYSSNTSTRQQFVYPRIDLIDGSEPSIQALLSGFDSINQDRISELSSSSVSDKPSIKYDKLNVGQFSEVGVTRGLVSWLPLIGDTKDRVTNEVATNNGAIAVGDGYEFDGSGEIDGSPTGDYISIPEAITNTSTNNYPEGCTYSVWLNVDTDAVDRMGLFWGSGTIRHIEIYSIGKNFRTEVATQNNYSFGSSSFPDDVRGVWSNFTIVFANGEAGRPVRWYQNGKLFHTGSMTNGSNPEGEYFSFSGLGRATGSGSYTYAKSFDGKIRGFRIYENTLTPEEIAQEYNSGKASLNKNSAFAKEFIEV
jgi:hypothetical protein